MATELQSGILPARLFLSGPFPLLSDSHRLGFCRANKLQIGFLQSITDAAVLANSQQISHRQWIQFSQCKIKHLVNYVYCPVYFPSCNQMPAVIAHVLIEVVFFFPLSLLCKFLECLIGVYITVSMHYSAGLVYCQCKQTRCTEGLFWCMFAVGHMIYTHHEYKESTPFLLTPHIHTHLSTLHRYTAVSVSFHVQRCSDVYVRVPSASVSRFLWLLKSRFFQRAILTENRISVPKFELDGDFSTLVKITESNIYIPLF